MNHRQRSRFQFLFSFFDLLALNIVFLVSFAFNDKINTFTSTYLLLFIAYNIGWLITGGLTSLYIESSFTRTDMFIKRSIRAFFIFLQLVILFVYFSNIPFSRTFIITSFVSFGGTIILTRMFFVWGGAYIDLEDRFVKRVVILGYNNVGKKIADHLSTDSNHFLVEGYFEDYNKVQELSLYPIIGNLRECLDYAIKNEVSEIYSTLLPKDNEYLYELAEIAENNFIRVRFVLDYNLLINRNMHVDFIEDIPVLSLRREPLTELGNRIQKRAFDLCFSILVIIFLLSWFMPLIALLIKLDSRGPVFYLQNRLGRDKKVFEVYKFRTMTAVESDQEFVQATKDDKRITKLGAFLRKSSIDELPQFFNVLKGDMSVVGPRPHALKMNDTYKRVVNKYMIRHFLKPGITGWAQVNGYRGETKDLKDVEGRIEHDIWYMENWTFWLDIKIIFLTIYNIFRGEKNAY